MTPIHDRQSVLGLQQAYADKTESFFSGLGQMSGNPCAVKIRPFGFTRTFIARGHDWFNRAVITGNESLKLIDEIISYYETQQQRCHIEWNPGNCYRENTWNDELGRHLLTRGFRPGGFRCVWRCNPSEVASAIISNVTTRHFGQNSGEEFLDIVSKLENKTPRQKDELKAELLYGQASSEWHHYVGYLGGIPCSTATMFVKGSIAYFDWAHTLEAFRNRGCHQAMIGRRLTDARDAGCNFVFAVTDMGTQSAQNLQAAGFHLAYNYIMLVRDPLP